MMEPRTRAHAHSFTAERHEPNGHRRNRRLGIVTVVVMLVAAVLGGLTGTTPVAADGNEAPNATSAARSIAAGDVFTCTLSVTGVVRCVGAGDTGQLGTGSPDSVGDGPNEMGSTLVPVDLGTGRTARALAAGISHACAVLDNGQLKCWGNNASGQLGLGDTVSRGSAPNEMGDALPAVNLGTGRRAVAVSAGNDHTCAILDNGQVKCWGQNNQAELGHGTLTSPPDVIGDSPAEMGDALPAVNLGTGRTARAISAGRDQTCAVLDNGQLKCWGYNASNQLGIGMNGGPSQVIGDVSEEMGDGLAAVNLGSGRTATAVSTSSEFTCALLDNGDVKCWGSNQYGKTGALTGSGYSGDSPGELGDNLIPVPLGTGRTARSISAASNHVCAVLDNDQVKCWGRNHQGQLGQGDVSDRGGLLFSMGDNLLPVALPTGRTARFVTTGSAHSCAILDNGTATCWGYGFFGQLGSGANTSVGDDGGEMGDALAALDLPEPLGVVVRRPDAHIRQGTGKFVGNDVYNTTGAKQKHAAKVRPGKSVRFTVRLQNDGDTPDTLRVTGPKGTKAFRVVYRSGSTKITKQVRAGTWSTGSLAPGTSRSITVTVSPTKKAKKGATVTRKITVRSSTQTTLRDAVVLTVRRR
jgi:alpha-tubulin suppressor-like RCC1 family protein